MQPHLIVKESDLCSSVEMCAGSFEGVRMHLSTNDVETLLCSTLRQAWDNYYFGDFSRFDRMLETYVSAGGTDFRRFMPVSISHHNLHRLMEVLSGELGNQPLLSTRIPERIDDLRQVTEKLAGLLQEVCRSVKS